VEKTPVSSRRIASVAVLVALAGFLSRQAGAEADTMIDDDPKANACDPARPIVPDSQTAKTPLAVRDEQGRFIEGNPGGPGRPAGRRDRINAALEALRDRYKTTTQAEAMRAFVAEVLESIEDNGERLELLRMLLPRESASEIEVTQHGPGVSDAETEAAIKRLREKHPPRIKTTQ
jgi:hypothetical protein